MADPISMMLIAGTVASTAGSVISGMGTSAAGKAQSRAMLLQSRLEQEYADRQAKEEMDRGYFDARQRREEATGVLSSLQARAAASGAGATNPTVFSLLDQIVGRTEEGAQSEINAARQRAEAIKQQAKIGGQVTNLRASAVRREANTAALGSYIGAAGNLFGGLAQVPSFGGTAKAPSILVSGSTGARAGSGASTYGYARYR